MEELADRKFEHHFILEGLPDGILSMGSRNVRERMVQKVTDPARTAKEAPGRHQEILETAQRYDEGIGHGQNMVMAEMRRNLMMILRVTATNNHGMHGVDNITTTKRRP